MFNIEFNFIVAEKPHRERRVWQAEESSKEEWQEIDCTFINKRHLRDFVCYVI